MTDAVAIWTHVAGQIAAEAPSPLAFVTAIVHGVGPFLPDGGIGHIAEVLASAAIESGVEFHRATVVTAIRCVRGRVRGVATGSGAFFEADAVLSNANGVGTYLNLASDAVPAKAHLGSSVFRFSRPVSVLTWRFAVAVRRLIFASTCRAARSFVGCWSHRLPYWMDWSTMDGLPHA